MAAYCEIVKGLFGLAVHLVASVLSTVPEQKLEPLLQQQPPRGSLYELIKIVLEDPQLNSEDKLKLIDELRKNNPGASDRWTYRYAILILGAVVLLTMVSLLYLSTLPNIQVPEGMVAIGSAAVGGLAGLLAPGKGSES